MALVTCSEGSEGDAEKAADWFGPGQVDQMVRQAVQFCWMSLPKENRNVDELKKQIQRLVERAFRDFQEDREAFGKKAGG